MTRPHQNSWRPYQSSSKKAWPKKKGWEDKLHRADDQIAPTLASGSTEDLQRWALVTANMPQQGHRKNETEIIERIQRRYEDPNQSQIPRSQILHHAPADNCIFYERNGEASNTPITTDRTVLKRRRSISPPPGSANTLRAGLSAVGYVRSIKRHRARSPSPAGFLHSSTTKQGHQTDTAMASEIEKDYDYAQSSEWSFPSSEDDEAENN